MLPSTPHSLARRSPRLLSLQPAAAAPAVIQPPCLRLSSYELVVAHRLAVLYQSLFPDRPDWLDQPVATDAAALMEATETFLGRVTAHRFPVIAELWEDSLEDAAWRLERMPVDAQGLDTWYEEEWDYYEEPLPLLTRLATSYHLAEEGREASEVAVIYDYVFPGDFQLSNLTDILDEMGLPGPLAGLADAARLVMGATGNDWLDYSHLYLSQCDCYPDWEVWPAWYEAWPAAQAILDRVNELTAWVKEEQSARLDRVVATLLAAHERRAAAEDDGP